MKNIIITGASGMIGGLILDHCLESAEINQVTSLVRKPTGKQHPKLKEVVVKDFLSITDTDDFMKGQDVAFFCLGVYTGAAPRDLFRQITVDYPLIFAKALKSNNPESTFLLLSGAGADRTEKSRMMFAKDKGAAENGLDAMGFKAFYSFRPSYIYPVEKREEPNFSYRLMRSLYPLIKMTGENNSIKSTELAQAMFITGLKGAPKSILENKDILHRLM